jgi:hypothetical protein
MGGTKSARAAFTLTQSETQPALAARKRDIVRGSHMTVLRLGRDLRADFNKKLERNNFKRYREPVTQQEVNWLLADLAEKK